MPRNKTQGSVIGPKAIRRTKKELSGPLKPYPTYGVHRVAQELKGNYGWYVRIPGHKVFFADGKNGGTEKARKAAVGKRDELFATLTEKQQLRGATKRKVRK